MDLLIKTSWRLLIFILLNSSYAQVPILDQCTCQSGITSKINSFQDLIELHVPDFTNDGLVRDNYIMSAYHKTPSVDLITSEPKSKKVKSKLQKKRKKSRVSRPELKWRKFRKPRKRKYGRHKVKCPKW